MNFNIKVFILILIILLLITIFYFNFFMNNDKTVENNLDSKIPDFIDIELSKQNTWNCDGKICSQYELTLKNNSDNVINSWKVQINNIDNIEIPQIWNGSFSIEDCILHISPMDYNKSINSMSSRSVGFIIISNNDFSINNDYTIFIDGIEYSNINSKFNNKKIQDNNKLEIASESLSNTPLLQHGKLSVKGTNIIDSNNNIFTLKGISTHGIAWFPQYVNKEAFKEMRDNWGINTIRIAMYSNYSDGYNTDLHSIVKNGIDYATELGLYVIIDWHILNDNNPNTNIENAKIFFEEFSSLYKNNTNIIYEICNEPNGNVTWDNDIKPYAETIISIIRKNTDSIIIVGTPTWSQDVDIVARSPITNYENIMYSLHFYAATHKQELRNKLSTALDLGLPVFVSEFGICDASGNGIVDKNEANIWIDLLNKNNISWICWNLSNKNESSSILNPNVTKYNNWNKNDFSECGIWLIETLKK